MDQIKAAAVPGVRGQKGHGDPVPRHRARHHPISEELLRRGQDKLQHSMGGNLGGRGIALIALAAVALWGFSGFFPR